MRIEADRQRYPVLLSNGNAISVEPLADDSSRHVAVWEDHSLSRLTCLRLLLVTWGDSRSLRDRVGS